MNRWIRQAIKEAHKSSHDIYRLGAVAIRGRKICGRGHNKNTIHGGMYKKYKYQNVHAEACALHRLEDAEIVLVVRLKADGSLSMSRPCATCLKVLRDKGVQKVYYTDWDGNIQMEKVQ